MSCSVDGVALEAAYLALTEAAGIDHAASPIVSYSFQLTRRWMLLVPRTAAEAPEGVGCNTVGYAGMCPSACTNFKSHYPSSCSE